MHEVSVRKIAMCEVITVAACLLITVAVLQGLAYGVAMWIGPSFTRCAEPTIAESDKEIRDTNDVFQR